jgi:hypothetical protein
MGTTSKSRVANPIAVRRFSVTGEPDREVVVTIGKPRPEPDPSVWRCSFIVEGLPRARRRIARGVDSLQALQNAIEAARRKLKASGLVLTGTGCEPGEIGMPRPVPSYPGSGIEERIDRYIDKELRKFARMAKARREAGQAAQQTKE